MEISVTGKGLQANFPKPSLGYPLRWAKTKSGAIEMVIMSLKARFTERQLVAVCISRVFVHNYDNQHISDKSNDKKWNTRQKEDKFKTIGLSVSVMMLGCVLSPLYRTPLTR